MTDNIPKLGDKLLLVYKDFRGVVQEQKMKFVNGVFEATPESWISRGIFNYFIKDEETGKVDDKNGKGYSINQPPLKKDATKRLRLQHRQPTIHAHKQGTVTGKLVTMNDILTDDIENLNEPTILLAPELPYSLSNNSNIVGIIFTDNAIGTLSHYGAWLRNNYDACASIFEPEIIEELSKLHGKNVKIELKDNYINFEVTNETSKPKTYPKIKVPELKYCDKILDSKEYSSDLVGAKAVNLRRLEELKEAGKIDVIIPKSVALPYGYIEKLSDKYYILTRPETIKKMEALKAELQDKGFNNENKTIMVRSAFNGEDLPNYSAAGIYYSTGSSFENRDLYSAIRNVEGSKVNAAAIISRRNYGIPEEAIKPTVLLQEYVPADYEFTLYTNYNDNKLRIEMFSKRANQFGTALPHVFSYDRKTKELTYDSVQLDNAKASYDENFNPLELEPLKNDLSGNKNLFKLINKLVKNALVIEKEFDAPQDIEGGLLGDKIYLWQTRNIVGSVNQAHEQIKPDYLPQGVWEAEQNLLKDPKNDELWEKLYDGLDNYAFGNFQKSPIKDYIANKILIRRVYSTEEKIKKINDAFRIYEKLLANNPNETVNKYNPIDMTTIVKVLLNDLDCKDIKVQGLENLKNGYTGEWLLSTYYSLAEMIQYARTQCEDNDITLKFQKPNALYTTLSYKGQQVHENDMKKIFPFTYGYTNANCIENVFDCKNDEDKTSIKVKMYTMDEYFTKTK